MAFRAQEAASAKFEETKRYLIPRDLSESERVKCEEALRMVVDMVGPAVESYPTWHPLVANHKPQSPQTRPNEQCGYRGLDHTRYFAHGFITCPYDGGKEILKSVEELPGHSHASIHAEEMRLPFYNNRASAILVHCTWDEPLLSGHFVPKSLAAPLMMEQELPCWRWAQRAEEWENMRPYLLGAPHGSRSSLFVDQDAGSALKKLFTAMNETGMFGPPKY